MLAEVADCCANYIDDVIVFSMSWEEHLTHLHSVLKCLGKAGLKVKERKCVFGR